MIVFYYDIYKFSLILFLAKFIESLKDIYIWVSISIDLSLYMKYSIIWKIHETGNLTPTFCTKMFFFEKFQVGGNVPNVPPGAGWGWKRQDLRLSAGQSQRGHEGMCMFAVHDNKRKLRLLTVKGSTLHWISYCQKTVVTTV